MPLRDAQIIEQNQTESNGLTLLDGVYDGLTMFISALKSSIQLNSKGLPYDNQEIMGKDIVNGIIGKQFTG